MKGGVYRMLTNYKEHETATHRKNQQTSGSAGPARRNMPALQQGDRPCVHHRPVPLLGNNHRILFQDTLLCHKNNSCPASGRHIRITFNPSKS